MEYFGYKNLQRCCQYEQSDGVKAVLLTQVSSCSENKTGPGILAKHSYAGLNAFALGGSADSSACQGAAPLHIPDQRRLCWQKPTVVRVKGN